MGYINIGILKRGGFYWLIYLQFIGMKGKWQTKKALDLIGTC